MKRDINSLLGYKIAATDGEMGEVKDFYFDDAAWTIRYLIVETGTWLSHRRVLVSPEVVMKDFRTPGKFNVSLTVDQIRHSPDVDTNLPVSRQQREVLHKHHAWENYWESRFFGGGYTANVIPSQDDDEAGTNQYDPHLRSAMDVSGYQIHARNGKIGHVNNFIINDDEWQLTHFVVDTTKWFGGKKVLVDVSHVESVQWYNFEVFVDVSIEDIENSPVYVPVE